MTNGVIAQWESTCLTCKGLWVRAPLTPPFNATCKLIKTIAPLKNAIVSVSFFIFKACK